jgi:hypothetical protein
MKKINWFGIVCLAGGLLPAGAVAQEQAEGPRETFVCNYVDGGRLRSPKEICNYLSFTSSRHAERVVERILQPLGLTRNFVVVECPESDNCFATVVDGKRFIIYDGKFMKQIESITNTDWSAISIVAHEIGHHLQGHTIDGMGSRPSKELEADRFSGFVLHQLGASLDESLVAIRTLASHENTDSHPGRQIRVDAIRQGWADAERSYPRWNKAGGEVTASSAPASRPAPVYKPTPRPATREREVETDVTVRAPAPRVSTRVKGCASGDCTNGMGILVRENQERYEGEFLNGKKHGVGVQYYPDGMARYKGQFVNDQRSGRGTYYFSNGDKYVGYFASNVPHGKGSYFYQDGERFSGTFQKGVREGYGILYKTNGTRIAGHYQNDERVR